MFGLPRWLTAKKPLANQETRETQVWPLGREDPLEDETATTPVFVPGKPHGQRSLAGYSPWCQRESDTTEWPSMHACKQCVFWRLLVRILRIPLSKCSSYLLSLRNPLVVDKIIGQTKAEKSTGKSICSRQTLWIYAIKKSENMPLYIMLDYTVFWPGRLNW